jgi:hypothetical protein
MRIILALAIPAVVAAAFASSSLGVVTSTLVVRSNATAFELHDKSQKLKLQAKDPIHVDIRRVTADAGDVIGGGWHGHLGPSLVVIASGSLTVTEPEGQHCRQTTYAAGSSFVHIEDAHRFVAGNGGVDLHIVYLMPQNALPGAIAAAPPTVCS